MSGPEFFTEQVKLMIVVRSLYGLNFSGADFRASLAKQLHYLSYRTSISEPDVWMILLLKPGGFM